MSSSITNWQCKYCEKYYSTKQVLNNHIKNSKRCLKNRSKSDVPIPPVVNKQIITMTTLTESELSKEKERIELQKRLDNLNKTPEQIRILELERKLKETEELLEYKQNQFNELVIMKNREITDIMKYKHLYETLCTEDVDMLEFFNVNQEGLMQYMNAKLKDYDNKLNEQNEIRMIYSYFVPKYWRCADKKRKVYKYRDTNDQVQVDLNLEELKTICEKIFKFYGHHRDYGQVFNSIINRLVDLDDGKEIGKNIESFMENVK